MEATPKLKLSFRLFLLNLLGAVLMATGVYQLAAWQGRWLAGIGLLLSGMVLVMLFLVDVFKRIGALQQERRQQDGKQG
jgi:hypothetical protein